MDERSLRKWLAERLGRDLHEDPVLDKLWRMLKIEGHVKMVEQMSFVGAHEWEEARRDLLRTAQSLVPYAKLEAGPTRSQERSKDRPPRGTFQLTGYEKDRAEALGEYLRLRASMHPLVRRFREAILGGVRLTPKQAHALVDSPAASRFPPIRFEREGIAVVGHTAKFVEHGVISKETRTDKFIEYEYVFVEPPGRVLRAHLPVSVAYDDLEYLRFPRVNNQVADDAGYSTTLLVPEEYTHTPVYPGSVLDQLHRLSRRLVEEYGHCWEESQAAWFVLTDDLVAPKVISARYDDYGNEHLTHGTITLTVEPWVPSDTVTKFYKNLQASMLGRKPRAPERRNLAVFEFVTRQLRESLLGESRLGEEPEQPSWQELMKRWNQEHPDQEYKKPSRFGRDFERGSDAVIDPYNVRWLDLPIKLTVP